MVRLARGSVGALVLLDNLRLFGSFLLFLVGLTSHFAEAQQLSDTSFEAFTSPHAEPGGNFAEFVAQAGDVDGDGTTDVLVGASGETVEDRRNAGRAYLLSSARGEVLRELEAPTSSEDGYFGYSVGGIGDANGDGVPDLLVGAAGDTTLAGQAYVFGGATGSVLHAFRSPNGKPGGLFGRFPAGVGDVNSDGSGDLLVGAIGEDRTYLFGGADGELIQVIQSPSSAHDHFGYPAPLGDIDENGTVDIAIGAPTDSLPEKRRAGRVFIVEGEEGRILQRIRSPNAVSEGSFGHSIVAAGNRSETGPSTHLLVGASGEGRAYLLDVADGTIIHELTPDGGSKQDDRFGQAVADAGDVDGDGSSDFLIGAPTRNVGGIRDAGKIYLFSGATGDLLSVRPSPNPSNEGYFGYSLAVVRDTEAGGPEALCAGAFGEDAGSMSSAGRLYCFSL